MFAKGLMQTIRERSLKLSVVARGKGGRDGAGVPATLDRAQAIDAVGEKRARVFRANFEVRDEQDELQFRGHRETLALCAAHNIETAVFSGRGIIRMTFEFAAKLQDFRALERTPNECIQSVHQAQAHGDAAPETSRHGHVARDFAGKWKSPHAGVREEKLGRSAHHRIVRAAFAALHGDFIVEPQRDAETIESRSEIGSARRDANGDVLHDRLRAPARRQRAAQRYRAPFARQGERAGEARL